MPKSIISEIIEHPESFKEWLINHPSRLADYLGICKNGKVIINGLSNFLVAISKTEYMPDNKKPKSDSNVNATNAPKGKTKNDIPLTAEDWGEGIGGFIGGTVAGKPGELGGKATGKALAYLWEMIDWDGVIKAIEEAVKSSWKKDKIETLLDFSILVSSKKQLLLNEFNDEIADPSLSTKKKEVIKKIIKKLRDLQDLIKEARKILKEEGDNYKDEANKKFKEIEKEINELKTLYNEYNHTK